MFNQIEIIEGYLNSNNINYKKNHKIKYETYFKTGGIVKLFITPNTYEDFKNIVNMLNKENFEYKIIGFTSNILLLDEIDYSIIISTKNLTNLEITSDIVTVEAGYSLQDFVRVAVINKAKGYEGLEGIPASIGGAIFMNAGAYGYSISENLISVECIDKDNNFIILNKNECNFSYRDSLFKQNPKYTILRAKFKLVEGNRDEIQKKIEIFHIARHSYQDFVYPNLGSMISLKGDIYHKIMKKSFKYNIIYWILKYIYKNPVTKFINRKRANNVVFNKLLLIYLRNKKDINLKYTMSTKSANILINDGTVSSKEIIEYIYLVHDLIDKKFHIENEIVIEPVYSISESFETIYNYIKEQKKRRQ